MSESKLIRRITLFPATAIVVGSVIGSGIFVSPASMAREIGSGPLFLGLWFIAGIITLFGAMTQCELASQFPQTGGLYKQFKEIFGDATGFLYGWANFVIAGPAGIAALAYVFALSCDSFLELPRLDQTAEAWPLAIPFLGTIYPLAHIGTKCLGSLLIIILTWINLRGVVLSARLQTISTTTKLAAILLVVTVAFAVKSPTASLHNFTSSTSTGHSLSGLLLVAALGSALSGAFWSYDGWSIISNVAGEIKDPKHTIPRALIIGTCLFVTIYMLLNAAYLYVMPIEAIGNVPKDRVAASVLAECIGQPGVVAISLLIILSTFDSINASILTYPRIYFAMAEDQLFFKQASAVHPAFHTPHQALIMQAIVAIFLLLTGSFDNLTSMYVFVNWLLYLFMAAGVLILRRRKVINRDVYRAPTWVPFVFLLFALIYLVATLGTDLSAYSDGSQPLLKSVTGTGLVLLGLPLFYYWRRKRSQVNQ